MTVLFISLNEYLNLIFKVESIKKLGALEFKCPSLLVSIVWNSGDKVCTWRQSMLWPYRVTGWTLRQKLEISPLTWQLNGNLFGKPQFYEFNMCWSQQKVCFVGREKYNGLGRNPPAPRWKCHFIIINKTKVHYYNKIPIYYWNYF